MMTSFLGKTLSHEVGESKVDKDALVQAIFKKLSEDDDFVLEMKNLMIRTLMSTVSNFQNQLEINQSMICNLFTKGMEGLDKK